MTSSIVKFQIPRSIFHFDTLFVSSIRFSTCPGEVVSSSSIDPGKSVSASN